MKRTTLIAALLLPILIGVWGCENDTTNEVDVQLSDMTCLGCHSSENMLKDALADMGKVATAKVATPFKDDG